MTSLSRSASTGDAAEAARNIWLDVSFSIVLFLLTFLPRAIYLVARSPIWHYRAVAFVEAVSRRYWGATLLATHPGVTVMWLAGIARQLARLLVPGFDEQTVNQQMSIELLPLVLLISLAVVLAYLLLVRLLDRQVAVVSSLLLALDPFHIAISKTLHPDAVMSVFAMLSALWMLMVIRKPGQNRWRHVCLSGLFAGLALLTKTPALFMVPYLFLCLGVWMLDQLLERANGLGQWRDWLRQSPQVLATALVWFVVLIVTVCLLWPSLWVQPAKSLKLPYREILQQGSNPNPDPVVFLGERHLDDPGPLFYPVNLGLKTTEITLPCFVLGVGFTFCRRVERRRRLVLLLMAAFVVFYTIEVTLARRKSIRYDLPAFQFIDIVAGFGAVYGLRYLTLGKRWLQGLGVALIVLAQFLVSIPRHPYYDTHYNRIFGTPKTILENRIVAGQEQAEGMDIAADYLNRLPLSSLLVVGTQIDHYFDRYFHGKTVPMTDEQVDYLVFARNHVVRGVDAPQWEELWKSYQPRPPKLTVSFDDAVYVWVYKVGPVIDEESIANVVHATVGQDFRLLGYDLEPTEAEPGESIHLSLYWEGLHETAADYTVFVHLLDPAGSLHDQADSQPQGGMYPTYLWDEGERIQDEYELTIADDAPPGTYHITIGLYELATLQRLPITDRDGTPQPDSQLLLAELEVSPP